MNILWKDGDVSAKTISLMLEETAGWNKNTTYSTIKKCILKGYIERREPNFMCHALISKTEVQLASANDLLMKLFDGSVSRLFSCLVSQKEIDEKRMAELNKLIEELE